MASAQSHTTLILAAAGLLAVLAVSNRLRKTRRRPSSSRKQDGGDTALEASQDFDSAGLKDRVLRKAETVLLRRTSRFLVVAERATDEHNYSAILRTCEALGVQHVWLVAPPTLTSSSSPAEETSGDATQQQQTTTTTTTTPKTKTTKKEKSKNRRTEGAKQLKETHNLFGKNAVKWLSVREFATTSECVAALRRDRRRIWVTDLSQEAECLDMNPRFAEPLAIPERLAIVFGSEAVGVSHTFLAAADKRVYLPLHGFADSLNLSVSAALVLQQLFLMCPEAVGDMESNERQALREAWYASLARSDAERTRYATMAVAEQHEAPLADLRRCMEHRTGWTGPGAKKANDIAAGGAGWRR